MYSSRMRPSASVATTRYQHLEPYVPWGVPSVSASSRGCTRSVPGILTSPLADLGGGVRDARPPLCIQILSISCSFWENWAKLCVHAPPLEGSRPPLGEILDPSLLTSRKGRETRPGIPSPCGQTVTS